MEKRTKCIVNGAVAGAAIGSGGGAIIGHQTDHRSDGALIGAAVGGIIGGIIGSTMCTAELVVGDADGDGVLDDADKCPGTPTGVEVNSKGCPLDSDGDGVPDYKDNCPGTSKDAKVDAMGCPLDSDGDGVPDHRDKCPDTPKGVKVDNSGCPLDSDGDGVYDDMDKCPDTPKGATVNERGCWAFKGKVFFDFNKSEIKSEADPLMKEAINILEENPDMRVEVQGHTDRKGPEAYNQMLSEKRAMAVKAYLIKEGIDSGRLEVKGYGESEPIDSNDTEEGRQRNRRVRFKVIR